MQTETIASITIGLEVIEVTDDIRNPPLVYRVLSIRSSDGHMSGGPEEMIRRLVARVRAIAEQ